MSKLIGCDLCGQTEWTHKEKKTLVVPSLRLPPTEKYPIKTWLRKTLPKFETRWVRDKPVSLGETDTGYVYGWEADVHGPYKVETVLCSPCWDGALSYWSWSRMIAKKTKDKGKPLKPATMYDIEKAYTWVQYQHPTDYGDKRFQHYHAMGHQEDWRDFLPRIAWAKYHELKSDEDFSYFMANEMEITI